MICVKRLCIDCLRVLQVLKVPDQEVPEEEQPA